MDLSSLPYQPNRALRAARRRWRRGRDRRARRPASSAARAPRASGRLTRSTRSRPRRARRACAKPRRRASPRAGARAEAQSRKPTSDAAPARAAGARRPRARARPQASARQDPEAARARAGARAARAAAPRRSSPSRRPPRAREKERLGAGARAWRARAPGFVARLGELFSGRKELDPSIVDEIEKVLLTADIGVQDQPEAAGRDPQLALPPRAQGSRRRLGLPAPPQRRDARRCRAPEWTSRRRKPFVLLVIGVNGSGKTTTIGKLAAKLAGEGKKVLLAAGDTFRAAAAEQLEIWAGAHRRHDRARQGRRRPVVRDLRRRQARRDRGLRRGHRRHRRPPAHQDRPDAGAAEGAARGRQGAPGRARTRPGW